MTVNSSPLPDGAPVAFIDYDLDDVLERYVGTFAHQARATGLVLSFDVDPDSPVTLVIDPQRLRRALSHLVSSAVKFTAPGEVTSAVRRIACVADSVSLRLSVIDIGSGLNAEQRGRLFAKPIAAEGTAAGLAVCRCLSSKSS